MSEVDARPEAITIAPARLEPEFTPAAIRMLCASIIAQLLGGTMAIGLFPLIMVPMLTTLGWSRTVAGSMGGALVLSAAVSMPIWGYLVDRFGSRLMVLVAMALTGPAFFALAAQSGSPVQGVLSFAVVGFLSGISVAHVKAQTMRFDRRRGVVLALLGMTVGLSFGLTPLVGKMVLDAQGWRAVFAVFGLPPLLITFPILAAWFRPPRITPDAQGSAAPPSVDFVAALRMPRFWMIVVMASCSGFVFAGMQTHFVAFLQERSLSSQAAVYILSTATFAGLLSQLVTGWLLDRWRTPRAALPFVAIALVGMLLLQGSLLPIVTIAGALLLQSGVGGELSMVPYLVSRTFGTTHLARIFGVTIFISQVISGFSPLMMGMMHDRMGSYALAPPIFAALLALSLVLLFLLGGSSRRTPRPSASELANI